MSGGTLRPRWGQPLTGIISFIVFFAVAWGTWFVLGDPRGPVQWFPYPFVMYLAMMILVGLWQHMFLGDWPFAKLPQPLRGIIMTVANAALVWFVIDVLFYRVLGIGFNFLSYYGLEAATQKGLYAQVAVVGFVLIGFFTYPVFTIFFGKWPLMPAATRELTQPARGLAEIGWASLVTLFCYAVLIVPFFGVLYPGPALNASWWNELGGTTHVHWVFGWWEWGIVILFLTANVWRMKPWTLLTLPQPWKGLLSTAITFAAAYGIALFCLKVIPLWVPAEALQALETAKGSGEVQRFLWLHSAELAGFTLIFFLAWHHYFDDLVPGGKVDSWFGFFFRTFGVLLLAAVSYGFYYYCNFGHWGLGNHHMTELGDRLVHGESLLWNFWWIIPLLWNEWFFHKWPFYVHEH